MQSLRATIARDRGWPSLPEGVSSRLTAAAHFDRDGAVGVSSARREGASRMDAIHRARPYFGGPFSDCACSARSDVAIGRPEPTIFLSTALLRLPAWAGNTRGNCSCNSWMVFGSQWRFFWPAGYSAHVGRSSAHTHLLAVLGVKSATQPVRHTFGNSTCDSGCAG